MLPSRNQSQRISVGGDRTLNTPGKIQKPEPAVHPASNWTVRMLSSSVMGAKLA